MKKVIKSILRFCKDSIFFTVFLLKIIFDSLKGNKRLRYEKRNNGRLTLLANAPSLKDVLPRVATDDEFKNTDFVVLNYFANCSEFKVIKPTHYCLADPMFFHKNFNYSNVAALFDKLQHEVDWHMNIYVPSSLHTSFLNFSKLSNPYLHIIPVIACEYKGFRIFRNWAYKHNYASPMFSTVAILAIYAGINNGYNDIHLYGVDHTFFNGLCVNERNEVCMEDGHFYDNTHKLTPKRRNDNNEIFKMSDYVFCIGNMFRSHDLLAEYAISCNVKILNCTSCSLIDSYARKQNSTLQ